jgi:hypothetical protein
MNRNAAEGLPAKNTAKQKDPDARRANLEE